MPGKEFGIVINEIVSRPSSAPAPVVRRTPKRVGIARRATRAAATTPRVTAKASKKARKSSGKDFSDSLHERKSQLIEGKSQDHESVSEEERKKIIIDLVAGKIAHKIPKQMQVEVNETVEIRVTKTATEEELSKGLRGGGNLEIKDIQVGKVMVVYLQPHDLTAFQINLTNRHTESQTLDGKKYVTWVYHIKPLKSGPQRLSVIAVVPPVSGDDATEEFEVFNEEIQVKVNTTNFLVQNWQFFVGGLCTILSGAIGFVLGRVRPSEEAGQQEV